jgi:low affinity Fe/Cu permease
MFGQFPTARRSNTTARRLVLPFVPWLSQGAQLAAFLIGGATILARVVTGPLWGYSAAWCSAIDSLTTLTTGGMLLLIGTTILAEAQAAKDRSSGEAIDVH